MLRSLFGGGTARAANNSDNAASTSESKDSDVAALAKKLTSNLKESVSEIEVSPPITRSWLYVNDQIRKVASVVSQEKSSSAISSTASDPSSSSSSSVVEKSKGLWESSGFDGVRYLLEAGKLNVMMRIVLEYVMFMQTPSGRESVVLNEAECSAFESNCAIIFQAAWNHVESVQTSELPLSASVLVSIMSICISMGLEGEALRDTSGEAKTHQAVSEIHAIRNPHPRPQLMILALTMWSSLGSSKAIAAVGDDKLAKEILRAQPTYSCFALFPVFALLCLNTSAPNNAGSGSSLLSISSTSSSSSPPPPTAAAVEFSERNFILLLLSALEGASRISNSEDFQSSRNKLLVEADQAIFKAMATVRSDSAISAINTASTPTIASTCEKLKAALTPEIHPRFAASAGITSMEARAKTRTLIDFCDAAIRRSSKKNESKE
jgi:hypothetical protein